MSFFSHNTLGGPLLDGWTWAGDALPGPPELPPAPAQLTGAGRPTPSRAKERGLSQAPCCPFTQQILTDHSRCSPTEVHLPVRNNSGAWHCTGAEPAPRAGKGWGGEVGVCTVRPGRAVSGPQRQRGSLMHTPGAGRCGRSRGKSVMRQRWSG